MKKYYKEINGEKVWLGSILNHNGVQIINPTEEQILSAGYIEHIEKNELSETQILENIKNGKIAQLMAYDESENVNNCYIVYNGETIPYWANKDERDDLKGAVRDCISVGLDTYRLDLRSLGISVYLNCEAFLAMLADLEVYAIKCFNKTTDHLYAINSMETVEGVSDYDFTVGYPEQPRYEL